MGNLLDSWTCQLCGQTLIVSEYPSKRGFKLQCYGTDAVPHKLRTYLDGFRKDAPFLVAPKVSDVAPRSRAASLLARVREQVGEISEESKAA